jgi:hypothetical protein
LITEFEKPKGSGHIKIAKFIECLKHYKEKMKTEKVRVKVARENTIIMEDEEFDYVPSPTLSLSKRSFGSKSPKSSERLANLSPSPIPVDEVVEHVPTMEEIKKQLEKRDLKRNFNRLRAMFKDMTAKEIVKVFRA